MNVAIKCKDCGVIVKSKEHACDACYCCNVSIDNDKIRIQNPERTERLK